MLFKDKKNQSTSEVKIQLSIHELAQLSGGGPCPPGCVPASGFRTQPEKSEEIIIAQACPPGCVPAP